MTYLAGDSVDGVPYEVLPTYLRRSARDVHIIIAEEGPNTTVDFPVLANAFLNSTAAHGDLQSQSFTLQPPSRV